MFAHLPGAAAGDVVFRKGDMVATYEGELISQVERARRYDRYTAPYGLHLNASESIDAALKRTVGSLANHARIDKTNARLSVDTRNKKGSVKATKDIRHGDEILVHYGAAYQFKERGVKHGTNHRKCNV